MGTGTGRRREAEGQLGNCVAGLELIELCAVLVHPDLVESTQIGLEIRNELGSATLPSAIDAGRISVGRGVTNISDRKSTRLNSSH